MRAITRSDYRYRILAAVPHLAKRLDDIPDFTALAGVGDFSLGRH